MTSTISVLARLRQHAGLPVAALEVPIDTLAEYIFQSQRGVPALSIDRITADIIECLDRLNHEVNQSNAKSEQAIDRQLAYAVSGIVAASLGRALELQRANLNSSVANQLLGVAWQVQTAWDAFVAGDIEDLAAHVVLERNARFG